jgi:hypothetical protein
MKKGQSVISVSYITTTFISATMAAMMRPKTTHPCTSCLRNFPGSVAKGLLKDFDLYKSRLGRLKPRGVFHLVL